MAAMRPARASASVSVSSRATTRLTRPRASASRAPNESPVRISSIARALPKRAGQPLGPSGAGHDPDPDLRLAEGRIVGRHDDVAGHGQLATAAEGIAAHRRDERQADGPELVPVPEPAARLELVGRRVDHLLDVGASREGPLALAGDDDRATGRIRIQPPQHVRQLAERLAVQRVEHLRPVEGHDGHAVDGRAVGVDGRMLQQESMRVVRAGHDDPFCSAGSPPCSRRTRSFS